MSAANMTTSLTTALVQCTTMAEVRQHIDAIDTQVVALLVQRTGYVAQAAHIKQQPEHIYDQARIDFIVARVRQMATDLGGQPDVLEAAYRALIGASIEFERVQFAQRQSNSQPGEGA
jgi:isochorismate pyruvate lyase